MIDSLRKKLAGEKGKLMLIGGRMVLLNFVQNILPLYFFSFYKALRTIIQKLMAIQRWFLCVWCNDSKKFSGSVGRRYVYLSHKEG